MYWSSIHEEQELEFLENGCVVITFSTNEPSIPRKGGQGVISLIQGIRTPMQ